MYFEFEPIGTISTPFTEKFGAPRQSLLVNEAKGIIRLSKSIAVDAFKDLEKFSHIWIIYIFHKNSGPWHPLIETPRVEAKKVGVFATRAPKRPNPIGMSVVKLDQIEFDKNLGTILHLSGVDILDGTPILDIKPYLPYSDCIVDANSGWIVDDIVRYRVEFSDDVLEFISTLTSHYPRLEHLIRQVLELDPRPTSQRRAAPIESRTSDGQKFAFRMLDLDIHWSIRSGDLRVEKIIPLSSC